MYPACIFTQCHHVPPLRPLSPWIFAPPKHTFSCWVKALESNNSLCPSSNLKKFPVIQWHQKHPGNRAGRFQKAHPKQALFSIPKALDPILSFTLLEAFLAISGRKIMAFKHSYPQVAAATMKLQFVPSSCNGTRLSTRWSGCNCHLPRHWYLCHPFSNNHKEIEGKMLPFPLNHGPKWWNLHRLEEHNRQKPTGCPSCHQESAVLPPSKVQQMLKTLCEDTAWDRQSLKHCKANSLNYKCSCLPPVLGIRKGLHARNPKPARPPWDQKTVSLKSCKKLRSTNVEAHYQKK